MLLPAIEAPLLPIDRGCWTTVECSTTHCTSLPVDRSLGERPEPNEKTSHDERFNPRRVDVDGPASLYWDILHHALVGCLEAVRFRPLFSPGAGRDAVPGFSAPRCRAH